MNDFLTWRWCRLSQHFDAANFVERGDNVAAAITLTTCFTTATTCWLAALNHTSAFLSDATPGGAYRAVSGNKKFFAVQTLHHTPKGAKLACGYCRFLHSTPLPLNSPQKVFDLEGKIENLEAFASHNGPWLLRYSATRALSLLFRRVERCWNHAFPVRTSFLSIVAAGLLLGLWSKRLVGKINAYICKIKRGVN